MIAVNDTPHAPDDASPPQASESYSQLLSAADLEPSGAQARLTQTMVNSRDLEQLGQSLGAIAESLRGYGALLPRTDGQLTLNGVVAGSDGVSLGSWKELLARNVGRNCLVSFLIGTQETVTAEGTLIEVGADYLVLQHPVRRSYVTADFYSVRFVEFRSETAE